jgi:hypothetical protein
MAELFVPKNPIETAQEFQWAINLEHPEVATQSAQDAIALMGDVEEVYGSKKLIIHSMSGYILNRSLTIDEQIEQRMLDEITVRGDFGGIKFVQSLSLQLQTFMVDMYNVRILEPFVDDDDNGQLAAPVLLPVLDVQSVLVAA